MLLFVTHNITNDSCSDVRVYYFHYDTPYSREKEEELPANSSSLHSQQQTEARQLSNSLHHHCSEQCTLYSIFCTTHCTAHCILYNIISTLYFQLCFILHGTLYCTLCCNVFTLTMILTTVLTMILTTVLTMILTTVLTIILTTLRTTVRLKPLSHCRHNFTMRHTSLMGDSKSCWLPLLCYCLEIEDREENGNFDWFLSWNEKIHIFNIKLNLVL